MEKRFKNRTLKDQTKIIVITGAESTGKSTLTKALAKHFGAPYIPEIAREYVENLTHRYNYHDVENIAKAQIQQINDLKDKGHPYIFIDTWLIITKIWFDVVFNKEPVWLKDEIQNTKIELFLICDIDIPWIPDPVRENGGENRIKLHKMYIEAISSFNFPYKLVNGLNEQRIQNALRFLKNLN